MPTYALGIVEYLKNQANQFRMLPEKMNPYPLQGRPRKPRERIFEVDMMRGFAVLLMILLHFACALADYENFLAPPANRPGWTIGLRDFGFLVFSTINYGTMYFLEFFFSSMFMFVAGVSCTFSRSNFQRGVSLGIVSVAISIGLETISAFTGFKVYIYLGILHAMSIGFLIYAAFEHFFKSNVSHWIAGMVTMCVAIVCYFFFYNIDRTLDIGQIPHPTFINLQTKEGLYESWKLLFGLARDGADYFSPVLTTTMIFFGSAFGKTFYSERKSLFKKPFSKKWGAPLAFLGQQSLIIYVVHTPVFYLLIMVLLMPFGFKLRL